MLARVRHLAALLNVLSRAGFRHLASASFGVQGGPSTCPEIAAVIMIGPLLAFFRSLDSLAFPWSLASTTSRFEHLRGWGLKRLLDFGRTELLPLSSSVRRSYLHWVRDALQSFRSDSFRKPILRLFSLGNHRNAREHANMRESDHCSVFFCDVFPFARTRKSERARP